jgi:hypothetical protein
MPIQLAPLQLTIHQVVDETSAVLHLPNETPIPMEADHRNLVRYLTSSSQNYIVVRDCLTELFDSIVDEVSERGM